MSGTPSGIAPPVGVIIPTHQRRESLSRTLDSLARQTAPADQYEVVVALDRCTDGTVELLERYRSPYDLRVIASSGCGRAAACNAALSAVRGDVVIILDDDMQVVPSFVDHHRRHHPRGVAALRTRRGAGRAATTRARLRLGTFARSSTRTSLGSQDPGHAYVPRDFYSGNVSLRSEVLRSVGGFDESFTAYGNEDVELWVRLAAAGVSFRFDPQALALAGVPQGPSRAGRRHDGEGSHRRHAGSRPSRRASRAAARDAARSLAPVALRTARRPACGDAAARCG